MSLETCQCCGGSGWNGSDCAALERERDEARDELEKLREALDWISKQYDDSKPTHQVAMTAYEMSCTARYALQKDTTK